MFLYASRSSSGENFYCGEREGRQGREERGEEKEEEGLNRTREVSRFKRILNISNGIFYALVCG